VAVWNSGSAWGKPKAGFGAAISRRLSSNPTLANNNATTLPKLTPQAGAPRFTPPPVPGVPAPQQAASIDPSQMSLTSLAGFNPEIAAARNALMGNRADVGLWQSNQQQHENEAYNRATRDAALNQQDVLAQLEAAMADRGILRSGANATEQGRIGAEYTRNTGDLAQEHAGTLSDINQQATSQYNQIANQEAMLQAQEAAAAAQAQLVSALLQAQAEAATQAQPQPSPTGQIAPATNAVTHTARSIGETVKRLLPLHGGR
jgi:hypothetical protein